MSIRRASVRCVVGGTMEPGKGWTSAGQARARGIPLPSPIREVTLHVRLEDGGNACLLIVSSDDPLIWCDDWFALPEEAEQAALAWYGVRSEDWATT
jgi:hypothetical protein